MSYSFTVQADTKDEAFALAKEQFALLTVSQPVHEFDRQTAQNAVEAFVNLLTEPKEDERVFILVSGSLGWHSQDAFTSAGFSVNAYFQQKRQPEQ